ncbi:uncharacterized protein F5147DRAFT_638712 [Suillus discolor]|uniref:Protein kinase domain-containing protein n=1 Tax=Suillus discolor TaxID=1912936 RepID=A0A9P7F219_9AGAM|nr:uncharacterized protein F5147DRAFT_638712 [Suillus discolor]KAG2103787.1 hypothetical protein F5147DRAFT_638712 [Suillus discolor]
MSEAFPDGVERRYIHIVVRLPTVTRGEVVEDPTDILARLNTEFQNTLKLGSDCPLPSEAAESNQYCAIQGGPRKIYDGRYAQSKPADTTAPPIQLFNPAFAFFSSKAFDPTYEVPNDILRATPTLMAEFATIYSKEDDRRSNLVSLLDNVLGHGFVKEQIRDGKCVPDGVALAFYDKIPICLIVDEEKDDFGDGGSDPSVQASFSFLRISCQKEAELPFMCNCPAFLTARAGPRLVVLGAILREKCIVQRLTDFIWIPTRSSLDDGHCLRIGRVMHALKESITLLKDWYDNKVFKRDEPRYDITSYTYKRDGKVVKFTYQQPLEAHPACVTYLAKTVETDSIHVVVKFVTRYGADAHMAMAEAGFAPKLLYYGPIDTMPHMPSYGKLRMVVMEYVDGTTASNARVLPRSFKQDLTKAIEYCHERGFVFGDLRKPNIMITKENKVQLIDFDWAGCEGRVTYPVSIGSIDIEWPAGVGGLNLILQQHDHDMLVRHFK